MSRLALVNYWAEFAGNIKPPLGLGYLASYVKKYLGFEDIVIINVREKIIENIKKVKPEIVGFTSYSFNYLDLCDFMRQTKEEMNIPILLGGPHITSLPHKLPPYADIGVLGEGEETLLELLRLYMIEKHFNITKLKDIRGIAFHEDGEVIITPPRERIQPLDRIPSPDWELLDIHQFLKPSQILMNNEYLRGATMLSSRGCPFDCIFCCVAAHWGKARLHSAARVVEEIHVLVEHYGVQGIYIADDLFVASARRIQDIIKGMSERGLLGKVRFFLDLRADLVTEELMCVLKKMGVVKISLGLESGSQRILRYLKGENLSIQQNRTAVKIANKFQIGCHCCFMLGAPPETKEDIRQTQELIKEILTSSTKNSCQITVTTPFPGTKLWDYALSQGYVSEDTDWRQFSTDPRIIHKKDFYINEHIDYDEFQNIVRETMELCNSRRLESIISNFSFGYVKKALTHPRLVYEIARDFFRHH